MKRKKQKQKQTNFSNVRKTPFFVLFTLTVVLEMKYEDALEWYDRAIVLDNKNAIYFSNRAFTHIKMEKLGAAIEDAAQAIELDPKYAKVTLILILS